MIISGTRLRGGKYYGTTSDPYFSLVTLLLPANGTNGAQNETFIDGSANNLTMSSFGNPAQGTMSPFSPSGYSNYFDGTGDFISIPSSAQLSLTGDFTIEMFFLLNNATSGATQGLIANGASSFVGTAAALIFGHVQNPTKLSFFVQNISATPPLLVSSTAMAAGQWYHVAITRAGSTIRLFVNGQQEDSYSSSGTISLDATLTKIGSYWNGDLNGYISSARVVKGTAVYTSNFTPPTAPLSAIANTSLLTCQSNRFIDNSSNNFTLTIAGETMVRPFSPFLQPNQYKTAANGGSAAFDGSQDHITSGAVNQNNFAFGTGDFTWECWIYPTSSPAGNNRVIGVAPINGAWAGELYVSGTTISYDAGNGSTTYTQTYSQSFRNQWSHLAVSRVSGTSRVFVNGVQLGASFADTWDYTACRFVMGTAPSSQTVFYAGYITCVKIVKGTGLYTANFTCPTAPPTATNAELLLNFTNAGIVDASARNNLETLGNAILSTAQSKWGTSSIFFPGPNDRLTSQLGANSIESQLRTGNFTIELWVYLASADVGSARGLVSKGESTTGYSVSLNSTEKVVFSFTSSSITSTGSIPTDSWVHIAVVRAGTGANLTKIYINGVNDGTGTVSTDFNQTSNYFVGAGRTGLDRMKGYMQDLRITRGYARYTANFTPPTAPFPTQ